MLKKLLIPAFMFTLALSGTMAGCGSDSNNTGKAGSDGGAGTGSAGTGGAGSGGGAGAGAGTTGSAGSDAGAGTTGSAGSDAGAGTTGAAGSDAAADTTGAAGSDAGSDVSTDVSTDVASEGGSEAGSTVNLATVKAACATKNGNAATPYTAAEFCALFLDTCTGGNANGITAANCMATYEGWAGKKISSPATDSLQSCVSYHLCNATGNGQAGNHCPHAAGTGPCAHP